MLPFHDPKRGCCKKCGTNSRIVVYRRNDGQPEWWCAVCLGQPMPGQRER